MVDASIQHTKARADNIFFVEKALREINEKGLLLDYEKFWIEIAEKFQVSERKAKEYIKIAKSRIKNWMGNEWARKP